MGFKIKVHSKSGKQVVKSHISDKQLAVKKNALIKQVKRIARPRPKVGRLKEIWQYNAMVRGMQNYYRIATNVNLDCGKLKRAVMTVMRNRFRGISKKGRKLTNAERERYGKSAMLIYLNEEPIYPIGYVQHKIPKFKRRKTEYKETNGAELLMRRQPLRGRSIEYADNQISLYFAQKGKCAVTGESFVSTSEIHCHHKIPKSHGGSDEYENLILVTATVHKLIHATKATTITQYLKICNPDMKKLNTLRKLVGNDSLKVD